MDNSKSTNKIRVSVPSSVKKRVEDEYNHKCAVCGAVRPQLHHIDEDPSNNDDLNLIPLCPNCHLTDQHSPTMKIDAGILALFRRFKDPFILEPQFYSIYNRMKFLNIIEDYADVKELQEQSTELQDFVATLESGAFFSAKIKKILAKKRYPHVYVASYDESPYESQQRIKEYATRTASENLEYLIQLRNAREEVFKLCVELLRFQKWEKTRTPK